MNTKETVSIKVLDLEATAYSKFGVIKDDQQLAELDFGEGITENNLLTIVLLRLTQQHEADPNNPFIKSAYHSVLSAQTSLSTLELLKEQANN